MADDTGQLRSPDGDEIDALRAMLLGAEADRDAAREELAAARRRMAALERDCADLSVLLAEESQARMRRLDASDLDRRGLLRRASSRIVALPRALLRRLRP